MPCELAQVTAPNTRHCWPPSHAPKASLPRVAYGLVYADRFSGKKDVFSPHAWVQVWTGTRWQSYDAGIGQFDATHLALSAGDGDPRDVQSSFTTPADLKIDKLGRVR